jgi:integrase
METATARLYIAPWNKGKLVGQKAPFKLKEIWAIRIRLRLARRVRELALFDLGLDSKLRVCDLLRLRVRDVFHGDRMATSAIILQQKTAKPVQLEITPPKRDAVAEWIKEAKLRPDGSCFPADCMTRHTWVRDSTRASSIPGCSKSDWVRLNMARTRCGGPRRR